MFLNNNIIKKNNRDNFFQYFGVFLLGIYPATFFLGTGALNSAVILLDIIFIIELLRTKDLKFLNCFPFYSLIIFWFLLLINLLFFSIDFINSAPRSIGFIRFILFIFAINYFLDLDNQKYKKIILGSWCLIFIITTFDLIFEFTIGNNILGFISYMPGRLAGFFNDELIMGHYFYGFILIIISFLYQNLKDSDFKKIIKLNNKNLIYFFIILFLIVSILIGERANFIRTLIMVSIFVFFLNDYKIKKKLIIILSATILFFIIVFNHQDYKVRFMGQFIAPFVKDPMSYITSSSYWDHYKVGIDIFNKNKSFGVGLKNYRVYTEDKNYHNPSIHPHQIQIEILSELGITGYISLLLVLILNIYKSIKSVDFSQNLLNLSGLLFIVTFFLPLLPTGSFFTSHAATLFWMNFALILHSKRKNI